MIGVAIGESDLAVCGEFFELFKTPWERYRPGHRYDAVLSTTKTALSNDVELWFIYNSTETPFDIHNKIGVIPLQSDKKLTVREVTIPLYKACSRLIKNDGTGGTVLEIEAAGQKVFRFGFDLFDEVRHLLTIGQPRQNALIPALDLHIALLRNAIIDSGATLIEIPPVPSGYSCMACLTHDVDFIGIRQHFFDHTMFGFLYRALLGSVKNLLQKRISFASLLTNWKAVFSLPLVYAGMVKDIWDDFDDYLALEKGLGGTYFFMPFKNRPGKRVSAPNARSRAAKYSLAEARTIIEKLLGNSCEIGVHGIDAWHDEALAAEEKAHVAAYAGDAPIGIRIHWLLFSNDSFAVLDKSGYAYDSSFGYNDAVGFKAGTAQVFRPIGCCTLLELPLHIQDVALFNEGRLHYTEKEAFNICTSIFSHFQRFGGAITLLWHTRSLAPERLQKSFYTALLDHGKKSNAWFATAGEIVEWFSKRRQITFESIIDSDGNSTPETSSTGTNRQPGYLLRVSKKDPQTGKMVVTDQPISPGNTISR